MKKSGVVLFLGICVGSFVCAVNTATQTNEQVEEKKVDDLLSTMMRNSVQEGTRPIKQDTQVLKQRVDTIEKKLSDAAAHEQQLDAENQKRLQEVQRCEKGLQELGSTMAEDPARRKLLLGGCAGAGAATALLFLFLL